MPAEYTPGPWVSKREGGSYTVGTWVQQTGYEGFGVVTARVPSSSATGEADARLIAAAPDLLAACEVAEGPELLEVAADWIGGHSRGTAEALRAMAEAMRAAMARARGEGSQ